MIPKRQKLTRSLFNEVFLVGKNINTEFFRVKKRKSDSQKYSVVISKKILKKATERNEFKRFFYNTIKDLDFKPENAEYIFISQKNLKQAKKEEVKKDIEEFLKK